MKALFLILAVTFFASVASADSFVTVSVGPDSWGDFGTPEKLASLSFTWDTTTNVLSNFKLVGCGPILQSLAIVPTSEIFTSSGIDLLNISGPPSFLQISFEGAGSGTVIPSAPGVYDERPIFLVNNNFHEESPATITVAPLAATPEPGTLVLLGVGFGSLILGKRKKLL
jgi:PEP-CTERM motif-containing protein